MFIDRTLMIILPLLYGSAALASILHFYKPETVKLSGIIRFFLFFALGIHTFLLGSIWHSRGYFPFSTTGEGVFFCSLLFAFLSALLSLGKSLTAYGTFFWTVNTFFVAGALLFLERGVPLPQSMRSTFFLLHASSLFAAYACFVFSFTVTVMYLIQYQLLKKRFPSPFFMRFPSLTEMDSSITKIEGAGLALLIIGGLVGFFWVNSLPTRPDGIALKAGITFLTILFYLFKYLARIGMGWQGTRYSYLSFIGFFFIIMNLIVGRHGH